MSSPHPLDRPVWSALNGRQSHLAIRRGGAVRFDPQFGMFAAVDGSPESLAALGALIGEQTRTAKARVVLDNPKGAWRPGLFVNVEVISEETAAPVTISVDAVQNLGDKPVVFLKVNGGFIAQPVKLGRSDGKRIEVLGGLKAGMPYASTGSFVVKSELGKGSAEHTH